jgi:hydrogenase maturation protease
MMNDKQPAPNNVRGQATASRDETDIRHSTLVLGLGNPLQGDDGVGIRVVEELERRQLPDHVEVMDGGTPGVGLINLMEGRSRVVIVDAAEMDRAPGEVVRFRVEDVKLTGSSARFSLHRSGVAEALALAEALGVPLPEIVVYGVQPAQVGWGEGLSSETAAAIPALVETIIQETQLSPETGRLEE